ncbi:peptide-methionine (S)-S-oxide reductase MsrA [Alkalimonas mucilaginosa]|uniref:Peptide methionine sulfoxide reductase MsrA n=1 Tax=Alkalimonas mucilaginosa TaxID=3057676 RepID=A0ABU7JGA3_9GAMM|nr:peptide-methionine (S)-S-oxide reductase MsrA [Alkalimonas sp. MEB004]MEE2024722.1 peptide-methionine (S)-S-oxide reductase MsrA [Alkalimonas sp. MEB004]
MTTQIATFGAGCFWCLEAAMNQLHGVQQAISGYMGGTTENPSYQQICTGQTGHAEVVQITFDPAQISYQQLCQIFFCLHDPTQLNRQGNDVGTQYRSVIFYHNEAQQQQATEIEAELTAANVFPDAIVTELSPASRFYPAEGYHQGYFKQNPQQGYCQFIVAPKLAKFRQQFRAQLKQD